MAVLNLVCWTTRCSISCKSLFSRLSTGVPQIQLYCQVKTEASYPPAPKRPLAPYFQYVKERLLIIDKKQGTKQTDLVKIIANEWRNLTPESKQKYIEVYDKEKEKFKSEEIKWKARLTKNQLDEIAKNKSQVRLTKAKRRKLKERRQFEVELKKLGKPKRPNTSFYLFLMNEIKREEMPLKTQSAKFSLFTWLQKKELTCSKTFLNRKEACIKAGEKWRNMTDEEKKPYAEKAKKAMETFKIEFKNWKDQMKLEGHPTTIESRKKAQKTKHIKAQKSSRNKIVSTKIKKISTEAEHKTQKHHVKTK